MQDSTSFDIILDNIAPKNNYLLELDKLESLIRCKTRSKLHFS